MTVVTAAPGAHPRRLVASVLLTSLAVGACSPGPPDNPVIGLIALWLAGVAVVTLIGGIAWLRRHPDRPRLATLIQGLGRSLGAILVLSAVVAGLLYAGMQLRVPVEKNLGYWSIDDQTLGVVVIDAPYLMCGITGVEESSNAVRIHAQCGHALIAQSSTGMAQQYMFQVTLADPLGDRAVEDGSGKPPVVCRDPAPDCVVFP